MTPTIPFSVAVFAAASLLLLSQLGTTSADTDPNDQAVLLLFWQGLTDKGSLNWNTAASLCGQLAVLCNGGKVVELSPCQVGIAGTIAPELGQLTSLVLL